MSLAIETKDLSDILISAEETKKGVRPLTELAPNLTIDEAYRIQLATIEKKISEGQVISGKKIGLTSLAMQQLLGVDEPDYGHLLHSMEICNGGTVSRDSLLQPKVEAEIAFVLKKDLIGPNVTVADVLEATDYIQPAIEIVDSRVENWKIKLCDTVADNASSGLYVLGEKKLALDEVDLKEIKMELYRNGVLENEGVGKAALGNPAYCVAWLANKLTTYGIHLKANEVILSGALSAAVNANKGDVFFAKFDSLGEVEVRFD
ncbi:2-keto-4-pentenoate hydratase [Sutcliffiella halmapala]|uniref:2-keto-4-pentenoate hydratase n=1 Tax=Sutcliffiella halmapala TaxID=79882 RepID=UPI000995C547|nr:2-keto-4-pentenoate hydratase [Sutcliffiella halmapala]